MTSWLEHHGVLAILILMFIDAMFPAASEAVMVYGGALASGALTHSLDVLGWHLTGFSAYLAVVLAGIIGYQLGSMVGWWIGDRGGRPFLERRGKLFHLPPERLLKAERWFERWGDESVLIGRVTPVARSFISIPAGVFEMPFLRYNVLTLIGNAVWCFALAGIGWALGASYQSFDHDFRYLEVLVVVGIVAAVAYWVMRRRRRGTIRPADGDTPR